MESELYNYLLTRYYAAVARTAKEQKVLINDFADTVFHKNSVRGVNREEPLDYDRTMDMAKAVLTKHGHSSMENRVGCMTW